ncbi:MAG: CDP-glucose 4,6-dehydratase [Desulfosalsimonadaceae bacterium]|nr:CDP-glucose 4,6-dehydratase [Desulfosalsimonadaceae bacterium]
MKRLFGDVYNGKKVLITGHTGFKGSWLAFWLQLMGADVCGYSLAPDTDPSHSSLLNPDITFESSDVRNFQEMITCFQSFQPEIVFHLAAQSLVRRSYREPLYTFETNIMGTANVIEAARLTESVRAVVVVTSDKCYRNNEWEWGYRESDPMGGHDPYSASKGCAELVAAAYRDSFFAENSGTKNHPLIATVRAGNVIGGGDWAEDRLIPDAIRAASCKKTVKIRNPHATRPWQHVLEPLSGYLMVGQRLFEGGGAFAGAWNFGPSDEDSLRVYEVLERLKTHWSDLDFILEPEENQPHEAGMLKLDSSRARRKLGWRPVWDCGQAIEQTIKWYRAFYEQGLISTRSDLEIYIEAARSRGLVWTK